MTVRKEMKSEANDMAQNKNYQAYWTDMKTSGQSEPSNHIANKINSRSMEFKDTIHIGLLFLKNICRYNLQDKISAQRVQHRRTALA